MLDVMSTEGGYRRKPVLQVRTLYQTFDSGTLNQLYDALEPLSKYYEILVTDEPLELIEGLEAFGRKSIFEFKTFSMSEFSAIINPDTKSRFINISERLNYMGSLGWSICPRLPGDNSIIFQRVKRGD